MGHKPRTTSSRRGRSKEGLAYPTVSIGCTPAERLAHLEAAAAARGLKPMTEEEFDRFIADNQGAWPNEAEIDEFTTWLHRSRREGQYR